jgi:hypothetical protein
MFCDRHGIGLSGRYPYCKRCKLEGRNNRRKSPASRHERHSSPKRARSNNPHPHANVHDAPPTNTQTFPCPKCTFVFNSIGGKLDGAKRSQEELDQCQSRGSSDTNAYNFSRLKTVLQCMVQLSKV